MIDDQKNNQQLKDQFNDINRRLGNLQIKFLDIARRAKNLIYTLMSRQDARRLEDVRKKIGLD